MAKKDRERDLPELNKVPFVHGGVDDFYCGDLGTMGLHSVNILSIILVSLINSSHEAAFYIIVAFQT